MKGREDVLKDLRADPERHRHNFEELRRCCLSEGALDLGLMDAHIGTVAERCDVTQGPCACGEVHGEPRYVAERQKILRQYLGLLADDGLWSESAPEIRLYACIDNDRLSRWFPEVTGLPGETAGRHVDERRSLLIRYLDLLTVDGVLLVTDATCKLFAQVDNDRRAL